MTTNTGSATKSSFELLTPDKVQARRRLVVNLYGPEKSGKTHLALTAPGPIYYIIFDPNGEEIAKKMVRDYGREIFVTRMQVQRNANQTVWQAEWKSFTDAVDEALKSRTGTLVIDTGTEMYELKRLAAFGRESNVQHLYAPLNRDIRNIFKSVYASNLNLIILHKMRDEYVNDKKTGRREPSMWGNMPFEVQANIETVYKSNEPGHKFFIRVQNNNMQMSMAGEEFPTDWVTFEQFLSMTFDA